MDDGIAAHVARTPLTTLALFSVTHTGRASSTPARTATGGSPARSASSSSARPTTATWRVQLVYTSFGTARNKRLFRSLEVQDTAIAGLVALADETGVDGINVDVELLAADLVPAYGDVRRAAARACASETPTARSRWRRPLAAPARRWPLLRRAGAERDLPDGLRLPLRGLRCGASAPMDRRDGDEKDLVWSLDLYEASASRSTRRSSACRCTGCAGG